MTLQIAVVDDDQADRLAASRAISRADLDAEVTLFDEPEALLGAFEAQGPDAILVDYRMPRWDGLDAATAFLARWPRAAVIMMTGVGNESVAVDAMRVGMADYITKTKLGPAAVKRCIESAIQITKLRVQVDLQRRELEAFARVVVHDMTAPLRGIDILTEVLLEHLERGDLADALEVAAKVRAQSARQRALLLSLKSYITADRQIAVSRFQASTLLDAVRSTLCDEIEASGASLIVETDAEIEGDRALLGQLVQNLVSNGIKYRSDRCPELRLAADSSPDGCRLSLADNGIGMPPEDTARVFDPFVRLSQTAERPGTGLGLSTCKRIADRHNGQIAAALGVERGTVFTMTWPRPALTEEPSRQSPPS